MKEVMKVKIQSFGIAKEICGASFEFEIAENATAEELQIALKKHFPRLEKLSSFWLAVNENYAEPIQIIGKMDEIALIPPVSGG
jgi:molybdopterin converting factor small subunit